MKRLFSIAFAALAWASSARADAPDPAALYERGAAAEQDGDFADAARLFARADAIAPNAVALEAAIRAATSADSAVFAMELVDRAERRAKPPKTLKAAVAEAKAVFTERVGAISVECASCDAKIDGVDVGIHKPVWVLGGAHVVEMSDGDHVERQSVRVLPESEVRVTPKGAGANAASSPRDAKRGASERDAKERSGAASSSDPKVENATGGGSPAWFAFGCLVTTGLGVGTLASGLDTLSKHQAFNRAPTLANQKLGETADARTQILGGATAAAFVGTVVVGAFFVRWRHAPPVDASAFVVPSRAPEGVRAAFSASIRARF